MAFTVRHSALGLALLLGALALGSAIAVRWFRPELKGIGESRLVTDSWIARQHDAITQFCLVDWSSLEKISVFDNRVEKESDLPTNNLVDLLVCDDHVISEDRQSDTDRQRCVSRFIVEFGDWMGERGSGGSERKRLGECSGSRVKGRCLTRVLELRSDPKPAPYDSVQLSRRVDGVLSYVHAVQQQERTLRAGHGLIGDVGALVGGFSGVSRNRQTILHAGFLTLKDGGLAFDDLVLLRGYADLKAYGNQLNQREASGKPGERLSPPFGVRIVLFLLLFLGGFLVSLRGWLNLDDKRRVVSAAWIAGGLSISAAGLGFWLWGLR